MDEIKIGPIPRFTISVKPMLFVYYDFYPSGGWNDFEGFFDSVEEAKEYVNKLDYSESSAHIVEDGKISYRANLCCKSNKWKWDK